MLFFIVNSNKLIIKNFCKLSCNNRKLPRLIQYTKSSWKSTDTIRRSFIEYFEKSNHKYIEPCPVVNKTDGSYFVNSGVSQFKDYILGNQNTEFENITKAVNSQRCIRLGGKKCDLENIGYDSTHLSYFEMLGNWSFKNYGKKEACLNMWKYLTEILELPASHLYVTYFGGSKELGLESDEETRDIWFNIGVKDSKILQFGHKDNFWEMGDRLTNPLCGPCTEIHWDYLATFDDGNDARCARCFVNSDSLEVVELWNCVFIQHRWMRNGTSLVSIPGMVVDTGMGLERLASVVQSVSGVYDTDNFSRIIKHISDISGQTYEGTFGEDFNFQMSDKVHTNNESQINLDTLRRDVAFRVIADHLRTLCICAYDDIQPGRRNNELKLRQILHRAIRQSKYGLEMNGGLSAVIDTVCETLQGQVNINAHLKNAIKLMVNNAEKLFLSKLEKYESAFQTFLSSRHTKNIEIDDDEVKLLVSGHFGSPISLYMIRAIAKDSGLRISSSVLDENNEEQDEIDPDNDIFVSPQELLANNNIPLTKNDFIYNYIYNDKSKLYETEDLDTKVLMIMYPMIGNYELVTDTNPLPNVTTFGLVTSKTNMYPVKGGQDSDIGNIIMNGKAIGEVVNVVELQSGHIIHWCNCLDSSVVIPSLSSNITLQVDHKHRTGTTLHHTAHHIIFSVMNDLIGRINQSSSQVKSDQAKLGFTVDLAQGNSDSLLESQFITTLERNCNDIIKKAIPIETKENMNLSSVKKDNNIRYLKSDRLPNQVRVVSIGDKSEVCCGTHAHNTAHLQNIVITSLKKSKQTVAEIWFVTGQKALDIRNIEKGYLDLCNEIISQTYWEEDEIHSSIKKFNILLRSNKLSTQMRQMINDTINVLCNRKNKPHGISAILKHHLSILPNVPSNLFIINTNITSMKKIIQTISDIDVRSAVMIYDDTKILFHIPKTNVMNYLSNIMDSTNHSKNEYVVEIPKVKNIDENILNQYILFTFTKPLGEVIQMKTNFENLVKNVL